MRARVYGFFVLRGVSSFRQNEGRIGFRPTSSLKQYGWRVIGQKELVKSASNPRYTRLFSAYIFLKTVCLEGNVMKHTGCPSSGGPCMKFEKNQSGA